MRAGPGHSWRASPRQSICAFPRSARLACAAASQDAISILSGDLLCRGYAENKPRELLCHPSSFLFGRETSVRREVIYHAGEMLAEGVEQVIPVHAGALHQIPNGVVSETCFQLLRCDLLIIAASYPGASNLTMAA